MRFHRKAYLASSGGRGEMHSLNAYCHRRGAQEILHPVRVRATTGEHIERAPVERKPDLDRTRAPGHAAGRGQVAEVHVHELAEVHWHELSSIAISLPRNHRQQNVRWIARYSCAANEKNNPLRSFFRLSSGRFQGIRTIFPYALAS